MLSRVLQHEWQRMTEMHELLLEINGVFLMSANRQQPAYTKRR